MTKTLALLLAAAPLLGGALFAADAADTNAPSPAKPMFKASDLFADTVVAKGKGLEIKRSQLDEALVNVKSTLASQNQTVPPEQMASFEQSVLNRLIQMQLLLAKATDADKAKAKDECAKRMAEIKTSIGSDENLNRHLKSVGLTLEQFQSKMIEESTAQNALERELKISVSNDDIKKFYDDNPSKFEQPEMVRASHILLSTQDPISKEDLSAEKKAAKRKLAEDLLKRARAGEDFAKLARDFSEDPGSKDNGGEYKFGRGQMVAEFETAAFSLKTNEISDIVTTKFGYHIIKLSEKIPAQKVDLAKVSTQIHEYLAGLQLRKLAPDYFTQIKKDAGVEILDERLKMKEEPSVMQNPAPASNEAK
jgi:peptidyl-prolyl cis-trans isomerase C